MNIDLSAIPAPQRYQLMVNSIAPRPIAWVSTVSNAGVHNLAPYSFFTIASVTPPVLAIVPANPADNQEKDTLVNIKETQECVVNIVSHELADVMNQTSASLEPSVDEFQFAGIESIASDQVKPLAVAVAPVRYECKFRELVSMGSHAGAGQLILLDVVRMVVADEVLENEEISPEKLDAVGRMGGAYYATTRDKFELTRPS